MLQNAHLLAKIGADTAENERKFAKHFDKNWQLPHGSRPTCASPCPSRCTAPGASREGPALAVLEELQHAPAQRAVVADLADAAATLREPSADQQRTQKAKISHIFVNTYSKTLSIIIYRQNYENLCQFMPIKFQGQTQVSI